MRASQEGCRLRRHRNTDLILVWQTLMLVLFAFCENLVRAVCSAVRD